MATSRRRMFDRSWLCLEEDIQTFIMSSMSLIRVLLLTVAVERRPHPIPSHLSVIAREDSATGAQPWLVHAFVLAGGYKGLAST